MSDLVGNHIVCFEAACILPAMTGFLCLFPEVRLGNHPVFSSIPRTWSELFQILLHSLGI